MWAGVRSWNSSTSSIPHTRRAWARAAGIGQQDLDGPQDLLVEVDQAGVVEAFDEARPERGEVLDVAAEVVLDGLRVAQAEPRCGQRLDPRGDGVAHGLALHRDQPIEGAAHVDLGDDVDPAMPGRGREGPGAVADGQRQAVEGAYLEPVEVGSAFLHLLTGSHVERDQAHGARVDAEVGDQMTGPLGEDPGLARSGRRDDARPATTMGDRRQLVGRELEHAGSIAVHRSEWRERADRQVHPRDHGCVEAAEVVEGSAVAPRGAAVEVDVAVAARRGGSLRRRWPARGERTVARRARERRPRWRTPGEPGARGRSRRRGRVPTRARRAPAIGSGSSTTSMTRRWRVAHAVLEPVEGGLVRARRDRHPDGIGPGRRRRLVGDDEDAAAERIGPGQGLDGDR